MFYKPHRRDKTWGSRMVDWFCLGWFLLFVTWFGIFLPANLCWVLSSVSSISALSRLRNCHVETTFSWACRLLFRSMTTRPNLCSYIFVTWITCFSEVASCSRSSFILGMLTLADEAFHKRTVSYCMLSTCALSGFSEPVSDEHVRTETVKQVSLEDKWN